MTITSPDAATAPPATPSWDFVLATPKGVPMMRLEHIADRKITLELSDAATVSFTMSGRDPQAGFIVPPATDLIVYRDQTALFRGRIGGGMKDDITETEHRRDVNAFDYRGLLARRHAFANLSWTNTPQADIAWGLITHTQLGDGGLLGEGVTRGSQTGTPAINRSFVVEKRTTIAEALSTLGDTFNGFSWWIDPQMRFRTGWRGITRDFPLAYPETVSRVQTDTDTGEWANAVIVEGGTDDPNGTPPLALRYAPDMASRPEGRIGYAITNSDIKNQAMADAIADRELSQRGTFTPGFTFTLRPGLWDPQLIGLGDQLPFRVHSGAVQEDGTDRIQKIDITIDSSGNETVEVTLGTLRRDLLALIHRNVQRLDRLERR